MTTWVANARNRLGFDPATGGQANMAGWFDADTNAPVTPGPNGTLVLASGARISSSVNVAGLAGALLPATPGEIYSAGITSDGITTVSIQWVMSDGKLGPSAVGRGYPRASVTATAPPNSIGAVLYVAAPSALTYVRTVDAAKGLIEVEFAAHIRQGDLLLLSALGTTGPRTVSGASFARADSDPGPLAPEVVDNSLGRRWYDDLPEDYRTQDIDRVLRRFLAGASAPVEGARETAARIASGEFTDPRLTDAAWVPWLAQVVGVATAELTNQRIREVLIARSSAPQVGTPAAMVALARQWLSGTRQVDVVPHPSKAWTILVRVRSDEITPLGDDPEELARRMNAAGQVPAGFVIEVSTASVSWAQVDAAALTDPWFEGNRWAEVDAKGTG